MKESSYNSAIAEKIEKTIGGRVIKISDKVTLGLPDSVHLMDGIASFIECKIGKDSNPDYVYPWAAIKDLRQYEVCRRISKEALVLYAIYYPLMRKSLIVPVPFLEVWRSEIPARSVSSGLFFTDGHGVDLIKYRITEYKTGIFNKLKEEKVP